MLIPVPVLNDLKKATGDLVLSHGAWQMQYIAGVGSFLEGSTWKIRILMLQKGIPPELQQYMSQMTTPAVTNETGPFSLLLGSGSGIHAGGNQGTLTAIVGDNLDRYLLSCHHVLGAKGTAVSDDAGNHIADADRPISFDIEPIPADAGIAKLTPGFSNLTTVLPQFPGVTNNQPVDLEIGAHVSHSGAVTMLANSVITDIRVTLKINMRGVVRRFSNVALVDPSFAQKGDSGSLVVDTDQQRLAGIVFAKGQFQTFPTRVAICSLKDALTRLEVSIV